MPAPTIDEITLADDPAAWESLGFALEGDTCRLGCVRLCFIGSDSGRGIVGWSLRGLRSAELDGLPTTISERPDGPEAGDGAGPEEGDGGEHPNGVLAIDHVVAMTPSFERSVAALQAAGLDLRRIREEPTPAGAPRQAFFRLGREILELVQEPEEVVAARADGPNGPARFWGLALLTADIDRTARALGEHAGEIRPAVQPGRRIATVRRSAGLALPLALMSARDRAGVGDEERAGITR